MKKKYLLPVIIFASFLGLGLAVNKTVGVGKQQGKPDQMVEEVKQTGKEVGEEAAPIEKKQIKNKKQVETKNRGEEKELEVQTQEKEVTKQEAEKGRGPTESPGKEAVSGGYGGRSDVAREHMSKVAKEVEDLLKEKKGDMQGGIGEKVSKIAKEQEQAQKQINEQLNKMEQRRGWKRKLLGPNYQALGQLEQHLQENKQRIKKLDQVKGSLASEEQTEVEEATQALEDQNQVLEEKVVEEEKQPGILGWLVKLLG